MAEGCSDLASAERLPHLRERKEGNTRNEFALLLVNHGLLHQLLYLSA